MFETLVCIDRNLGPRRRIIDTPDTLRKVDNRNQKSANFPSIIGRTFKEGKEKDGREAKGRREGSEENREEEGRRGRRDRDGVWREGEERREEEKKVSTLL